MEIVPGERLRRGS